MIFYVLLYLVAVTGRRLLFTLLFGFFFIIIAAGVANYTGIDILFSVLSSKGIVS